MNWKVRLARPAEKNLKRIPRGYRALIMREIDELGVFPFGGDVQKLGPQTWRRRVASYRIFYDVYYDQRIIVITAVTRRTSSTY
ncbi:MAG: type II toxin-antitoxin system RelE/ParE family toxin [Candidatus Niyogibacteria bacterium]|nr:type II toxin-antitoxin system RelE/ParE family toxin [Candidatus Niyogibacteria bacterium]